MLYVQYILENLPTILEGGNNLAGMITAVLGGICALNGIRYLTILRQKKVAATFSFEAQLYARLYELKLLLDGDELLLTNFFSDSARKEWGDQRAAPEVEVNQFYIAAQETLSFIKNAEDQMPAYSDWVSDYAMLIQFLVDVLHFDIRDSKNRFKYIKPCSMTERTALYNSTCAMLDKLMGGIKEDQTTTTKALFSRKGDKVIAQNDQQHNLLLEASAEDQPDEESDESGKNM